MNKTYDAIIIGAGPAGIFTALELMKHDETKKVLLMDSGRKIALGRANDVLTPANLDRIYGMDVAAWMRGLYRQWAE